MKRGLFLSDEKTGKKGDLHQIVVHFGAFRGKEHVLIIFHELARIGHMTKVRQRAVLGDKWGFWEKNFFCRNPTIGFCHKSADEMISFQNFALYIDSDIEEDGEPPQTFGWNQSSYPQKGVNFGVFSFFHNFPWLFFFFFEINSSCFSQRRLFLWQCHLVQEVIYFWSHPTHPFESSSLHQIAAKSSERRFWSKAPFDSKLFTIRRFSQFSCAVNQHSEFSFCGPQTVTVIAVFVIPRIPMFLPKTGSLCYENQNNIISPFWTPFAMKFVPNWHIFHWISPNNCHIDWTHWVYMWYWRNGCFWRFQSGIFRYNRHGRERADQLAMCYSGIRYVSCVGTLIDEEILKKQKE